MKKSFLVLLVIAFGCQQGGGPITQADKDSIQSQLNAFGDNVRANGNPADLYSDDAVSMPPHEAAVSGKTAIGDFHANPDAPKVTEFTLSSSEIEGSGNIAFARGVWSFKGTVNDTLEVSDNGKFLVVYKKQADNSWKTYREIWNSDQPMPGGN